MENKNLFSFDKLIFFHKLIYCIMTSCAHVSRPGKSANKHLPLEEWKSKIALCFNDPEFKPPENFPIQSRIQQLVIKVKYEHIGHDKIGLLEWCPPSWNLIYDSKEQTIEERIRLYYTGDVNRAIGQIL